MARARARLAAGFEKQGYGILWAVVTDEFTAYRKGSRNIRVFALHR